jgi:hypothetical protein
VGRRCSSAAVVSSDDSPAPAGRYARTGARAPPAGRSRDLCGRECRPSDLWRLVGGSSRQQTSAVARTAASIENHWSRRRCCFWAIAAASPTSALRLALSEGFRKRPTPPSTRGTALPQSNPTAAMPTTRVLASALDEHQHDRLHRPRLPQRRGEPSVRGSPDVGPQVLALNEKRSKHGSSSLVAERQTTDHEVEGDTEPALPVQA